MTFVALDDKQECFGYYTRGNLVFDSNLPENLNKTWRYMPFLHTGKTEYAQLYCNGKSLDEVCPEHVQPEWERLSNKMKAYIRSFSEAKINLNEVCFYDLVPEQFLKEFFDAKCRIIDHVFDTFPKPPDYAFRLGLEVLLGDIRDRRVKLDLTEIKKRLVETRVRNFVKKLDKTAPYVYYDQFGTRTGRLTTTKNTLPILTMDRDFRGVFEPTNGWYVELDYNAAELRTLLALSGLEQPDRDIHEWNKEQLGASSREQIKQDFFAWLYGSQKVDGSKFSEFYKTEKVKNRYWDGEKVTNRFGREMLADDHRALNYIIQSTTSDLVLRQTLKVYDLLKEMKSHIAFIIHDSIIIDLDIEEKDKISEITRLFSDTIFGKFKTNVRVGKRLNKMKEVVI